MTLTASPPQPAIGSLIAGRYRVVGQLGQGGMGTVWRAQDTADGAVEVALKTIRAEGEVTTAQAMAFREEYRAMTRLGHPNTIAVRDFGQIDVRTRYLAMELVPGRELVDVIAGRPLPLDEAYGYLIQLLEALGFIHSRLYVHRDVKAQNVRIRDDGTLKLMDFGLMAQLGTRASGGSVSGSPGYLAPEALRGGTLEAATDLYAVGCLAFEMLTGALPFQGKLIEVVRAHLDTPAPALRTRRPDAPEALEALVAKLLSKDPGHRYRHAAEVLADLAPLTGAAAKPAPEQVQSYLVAGQLVGRDAELAALEAALARADQGLGAAVLVGAPAGTGKSRLIGEALVRARLADRLVLTGRCQQGGNAPFEPLADALRPLLGRPLPAPVPGAEAALAWLFARRAVQTAELTPQAPIDDNARRAALDAIAAWLAAHAQALPIVLAIDDLHWADAGTLEALRHLARKVVGTRVAIVGALRDDEPGAQPLLRAAGEVALATVRLAPFSATQVDALLTATLRDYAIEAAVLDRLMRTTGGNAFFVTEALRLLMGEGRLVREGTTWRFPQDPDELALPATVEAAVLRRLAGLEPGVLALARAACVVGPRPCRTALAALVPGGEDALFAGLDELVRRQAMVREADGYGFFHDRVREALYADMPAAERQALHRGYAGHLEATADAGACATVTLLAHHWERAGVPEAAWGYHRKAAQTALAAGALQCALEHWQGTMRAAEASDHPDRETRLAEAWWEFGSRGTITAPAASIEVLEKLIGALEATCFVDLWCDRMKALVKGIRHLPASWRDAALTRMMTPAPYVHRATSGWRRYLPPHLPSWLPRLVETYGFLAAAHGFAGRPAKGLAIAERALALFPFDGTPLEGALRLVRCTNLFPAGELDALLSESHRALALLEDDRYPCPLETRRLTRVAAAGYRLAVTYQGRRPDAGQVAEARALAEDLGTYDVRNEATHWAALWAAWSGRRAVARSWIDEAARTCREADAPPDAHATYLDGLLQLQGGDAAGALAAADRGLTQPHFPEFSFVRQRLVVLRGQALLANGQGIAAQVAFQAALTAAEANRLGLLGMLARLGLAEAALAEGDAPGAEAPLAAVRLAAGGGPLRNPLIAAIAERLLARVDMARGDWAGAEARLNAAMATVTEHELDNPLEQAHVAFAMGELRAKMGDRAAAVASLTRAADMFHGMGLALEAPVRAAIAALPPAPTTAPLPGGADAPATGTAEPAPPAAAAPNWMVTRAFGL